MSRGSSDRDVSLASAPGLNDYRAILHAHAEDSAHTGGTRPEMLADAKRVGVSVICLATTSGLRPTSSRTVGAGCTRASCSSRARRIAAFCFSPRVRSSPR